MATKIAAKKKAAPAKKTAAKKVITSKKETAIAATTHLKIGDKAPDFTGVDESGKAIALKNYAGKKVVLYFYPKDDTPGCTAEACSLRDNYSALRKKGIEIIGVSTDNEVSHKKFIAKYELPFKLIADTNHDLVKKYGVWGEKSMYGRKYMGIFRTTFIISEKGIIEQVISKVNTGNHAEQIMDLM